MKRLKVRVPITVEIDREGWDAEYMSKDDAALIRSIVYETVLGAAQEAFKHLMQEPNPIITLRVGLRPCRRP